MKTKKQINREIFRIAIPNILSNITIPLLGITDTILMGYNTEKASVLIGAIGLGSVIFSAIYWNFGFLRISATGITSQAYGAKDREKQALTLFRALLLGILIAAFLFATKGLISKYGFSILEHENNRESLEIAKSYFNIRILALPAVMLLYGLRGWFYGMQNAIYPLILTFVVNLVNIGASIYCVQVLHLEADGVAWGTVIGQYTCLLVAVALLLLKYSWVFTYLKTRAMFVSEQIQQFFSVSGFVFGRNILLFLVFAIFSYYSSTVDENYFAANQLLLELFYLMSFAVDGFAYASEALVGKYTGENNVADRNQIIHWTLIWGLGFGCLYAILFQWRGAEILSLLTSDQELVEQGRPYIFWLSIISIGGAFAFIWDGIFVGATLVRQMFLSMLLASMVFIGIQNYFKLEYPKQSIWLAMTLFMFVRGILQWWLFHQLKEDKQVVLYEE